ncbi:hypothetical protein DRQ09_04990 [candidate division KSB1 bacterium]|nr:MAG: hypothetical protein DRQ09_04990 [candidate division KSB1 bacterium]
MKLFRNKRGFTLIELVMVIVILGILASVAVPKFQNIADKAREAATLGVVGGVRAGITATYASNLLNNYIDPVSGTYYPGTLDNAASGSMASPMNPFFINVLDQGGITKDWLKGSQATYYYTNAVPADSSYHYLNTNGSFVRMVGR